MKKMKNKNEAWEALKPSHIVIGIRSFSLILLCYELSYSFACLRSLPVKVTAKYSTSFLSSYVSSFLLKIWSYS